MDRAKQLTSDHFDNYVGPLLLACGIEGSTFNLCEFMYKTSGIHFYGHAIEDARETARAAFTPVQEEKEGALDYTALAEWNAHKANEEKRKAAVARHAAFTAQQDKPSFPFTFPPALKWMGKSETEYDEKLIEEVDEVIKAKDSRERMMELLDVLHVAETAVRTLAEKTGLDPAAAIVEVIRKNSARNYYQG